MPPTYPFPASRLVDNLPGTHRDMSLIVGVSRRTVAAWATEGRRFTDTHADRYACAAGLHPAEVWPDWWLHVPRWCDCDHETWGGCDCDPAVYPSGFRNTHTRRERSET